MRKKTLLGVVSLVLVLSMLLAACAKTSTTTSSSGSSELDALIAAAKKEGSLTVIALPHDWCNYGEAISTFSTKYGITMNELNPDGGSADEIQAIVANKDNKGPQAPDVIDVGNALFPKSYTLFQQYILFFDSFSGIHGAGTLSSKPMVLFFQSGFSNL